MKKELDRMREEITELEKRNHTLSKAIFPMLLKAIETQIEQIAQWYDRPPIVSERAAAKLLLSSYDKLEGLVTLLEVFDCGSTGGFGEGQTTAVEDLIGRAEWLLKKYRYR